MTSPETSVEVPLKELDATIRPAPIMLENLLIIFLRISQIFLLLFFCA